MSVELKSVQSRNRIHAKMKLPTAIPLFMLSELVSFTNILASLYVTKPKFSTGKEGVASSVVVSEVDTNRKAG